MALDPERRKSALAQWDEVQLRSVSDPPTDLASMTLNDEVWAITNWLYENFESPDEATPYDGREGGFQYIWGGPYETRDIIESIFSGDASEKAIEIAIEWIDSKSINWVPNQNRILPPEDERDQNDIAVFDVTVIHQDILKQIAGLRSEIAELRSPKFGIGHNGGPVEEQPNLNPPLDERDFRDLLAAFDKIEKTKPWPERSELAEIENAQTDIKSFGRKLGDWVLKRGEFAADGIIKGASQELGKFVGNPSNWPKIYVAIDILLNKIGCWISAINLPF